MDEPAALRPLVEVTEDIRRLDDYESNDDLAAAILAVTAAIERALRTRLRNDPTAPDDHRLTALAPDRLSLAEVVSSLRTRDLISLETAGTVHETSAAAARAEAGAPRPADADVVKSAVERLRVDLASSTAPADEPTADELSAGAPPATVPGETPTPAELRAAERAGNGGGGRWMRWIAAALAAFAIFAAAWVFTRSGGQEYDAALTAFRSGRLDSAAAGFERVLDDRPGHTTSMLYLARSYRRLDRPADAAAVLRRAVEGDPEDAGVRRELGHLFMDLDRLPSAIAQYELAVEHGPDEPLNWVALIQALRAAGDASADLRLQDAPADVQAALGGV